jgi:hypothetical protein
MAHLLVYKQQQDLEVKFGWPRMGKPKDGCLREVIPLLGTPKDGFKASELHKGMVVMMENGISGLHKRFWIIGLLWISADMSECMILLNGNYENASEYAFGVLIRNVGNVALLPEKHYYHHHKTERDDYDRMIIRAKVSHYNPRTQHLFKPDMGLDSDFPEILSSCGAAVEQLPSVMALQQLIDASHIEGS